MHGGMITKLVLLRGVGQTMKACINLFVQQSGCLISSMRVDVMQCCVITTKGSEISQTILQLYAIDGTSVTPFRFMTNMSCRQSWVCCLVNQNTFICPSWINMWC